MQAVNERELIERCRAGNERAFQELVDRFKDLVGTRVDLKRSAIGNQPSAIHTVPVSPLLKWAGGKRQLLPHLRRFYPQDFGRYNEPFVGSGAVFFDLHSAGRLLDRDVVLIDSNADLIGCYEAVRDSPEKVVDALEELAAGHARDGHRHYYRVRDRQFNPRREGLRSAAGRDDFADKTAEGVQGGIHRGQLLDCLLIRRVIRPVGDGQS